MKHSQTVGILAALLVIASCFLPWIEIEEIKKTINGIDGMVNANFTFGKQIKAHGFFCIISISLFLVNKIWAKRTNIFFAFLNFSWALKNYILFKMCRMGDCPNVLYGMYLLVLFSFVMQVMALLPSMKLEKK